MPFCPHTYGFASEKDNEFVTFRLRQIAAEVGAPVKSAPCFPDVEIYFASSPQELLDGIRAHGGSSWLSSRPSRAKLVAQFVHPIQAWYASVAKDDCGFLSFDNEDNGWDGAYSDSGCRPPGHGVYSVTGSRIHPGLESELGHVYIVVDVNQTQRTSFQAVADYIALLALSRITDFEACEPLPSIANLMTANCDPGRKSGALTDSDMAYLTGIYKMDPGATSQLQQISIYSQITQALEGRAHPAAPVSDPGTATASEDISSAAQKLDAKPPQP